MRHIAILASGSGTNAENIISYFSTRKTAQVALILSNKRDAYVLKRAEKYNIPSFFFERNEFYTSDIVLNYLFRYRIDFIVLAGFLWLVPGNILSHFNKRIINIHPALLPRYGGKGMYGENVHREVIANNDQESGISIHYVNEKYDKGDIIFQAKCNIDPSDNAESLAVKIHALEYKYFPQVIEELINKLPQASFDTSEEV
jgi:phosphoribosylglycinamide formyltransferase 1